jgi:hypothetical protein
MRRTAVRSAAANLSARLVTGAERWRRGGHSSIPGQEVTNEPLDFNDEPILAINGWVLKRHVMRDCGFHTLMAK